MKQIDISQMNKTQRSEALNEAKILQSLTSPYIVAYYNSFIENEKLCIVMEYCESGDLSQYLKAKHGRFMEEDLIWKCFLEICLALLYLHNRKILHRDIKTMNVFLTKDFHVRLGDLGVAKVLSQNTNFARTIVGTPYYLSPELCQEKPYNEKSDVWSLGCLLYEMCALKHPFESRNQAGLMMKIIQGRYEPLPNIYSKELTEIVTLCLQKDYRRRPSIHDILALSSVQLKARTLRISIPDKGVLATKPIPKKPETKKHEPPQKIIKEEKKVQEVQKKLIEAIKKPMEPIKKPIEPANKVMEPIKKEIEPTSLLQKECKEVYKLIEDIDKKEEKKKVNKHPIEVKKVEHNINAIYKSNQQLKSPEVKEVVNKKPVQKRPPLVDVKKSPPKKTPQIESNKAKLVDHKPTPAQIVKEAFADKKPVLKNHIVKEQIKATPKIEKLPLATPVKQIQKEVNVEKLKPKPLPRAIKETRKTPLEKPPVARNKRPIVSSNKINKIVKATRPYTANRENECKKSKIEEEIREVANLPDLVGDPGRNHKEKPYKIKKPTLDDIFGDKNKQAELTPTATEDIDSLKDYIETPTQEITEEFNNPLLMPVGYVIGSEKVEESPKRSSVSVGSDDSFEEEDSNIEEKKILSIALSKEEILHNKLLKKKEEYEEKLESFERRKRELAKKIPLEAIEKCCKLVDDAKTMVSN
jgi:NIMA (never in mitosis gene a)-related kinase